ncbi:hypothetical protein CC85DRAFT_285427 [Cutaneotrichosporon oleaginosum]|uniref:N-acetyltransferase domain-containing protein n=1 Tax=Cutaneotrichosporon oleaginosum TaxID=879819 RepID=A0A0J0XN70_9TREE|nr:uncharacterized protein CC85DRAFT_285427 [Cutaneotrichosporon oleaginosum]KLT42518.1 hypothetical protein CC85DRAFT_285427 [Cutaneotrichosporon oleaginosum]TXT07790.1 hypothetical protein COLE_04714 [Cutaneotrichosporon oleaginosum]
MAQYNTAGTVSAPLELARGEHEAVAINGNGARVAPPPKVTLTSLTPNNTGTLRKIYNVVLPVTYSERFYKSVLDPSLDDVNKLVYYADIPVGACCCSLENVAPKQGEPTLAILTLAVLAPYRSQGLGSALVRHALRAALHPTVPPPPTPPASGTATRGQLKQAPPRVVINRATVHVQVGNEDAKRFYERLGFKEDKVVDNYYKNFQRMEPKAAWLLVCDDIAGALGETGANGA